MTDTRPIVVQREGLSAGAGIAIAGIWLAAAGLSALIALIEFVWTDLMAVSQDAPSENTLWAFVIAAFLVALPLIAAYSITKSIINNQAD